MKNILLHLAILLLVYTAGKVQSAPLNSCMSVTYGHSWQQGQNGDIALTFPASVNSWEAVVEFDSPISSFNFYNGQIEKISDTKYKITNKNYNGVQQSGSVLTGQWQALFSERQTPPKMISANLVSPSCSGGSGSTTTTSAPSTTTQTEPSTTAPTAPSTTTTQTIASTSTGNVEGGSTCSFDYEEKNSWNTGLDGRIIIKSSKDLDGWTIEIKLTGQISSLSMYTANVDSFQNGVAILSNKNWNGKLTAGSELILDWQALFAYGGQIPTIDSIKLDGETCSMSQTTTIPGSTTTTQSSTTTTTQSTTITPIVTTAQSTTTTQPSSTSTDSTSGQTTTSSSSTSTSAQSSGSCDTDYDYDEVIRLSNLFYQAQRSGSLDEYGDFNHEKIPYRGDSCLNDGSDKGVDLTGGYFDAGDYVKFNFPMAASTTLLAWGAIDYSKGYAAAGQTQATLNTIKWATDYFIKCHVSPNELYAQVGDGNADHAQWDRIETMNIARPSFKIDAQNPGSDLAGEIAASLAAASLAFKTADPSYSAELLRHAKELFSFADTYKGKYSDSVPGASSFYNSWSGYNDELLWSAAWLYKATGEEQYLDKANSYYQSKDVGELSWDEKTAGATILLAQLTGEDKFVSKAAAFCNNMADSQQKTPKGMVWIQQWGPLRHAANVAFACLEAAKIENDKINKENYINFAKKQIHYALGDTGRSFVIGFGTNPPKRPHHRSSSCPADANQSCGWNDYNSSGPNPSTLWGALVGGPDQNDNYADDRSDYISNEVACDYNAGFQSAVAGLRTLAAEGSLPGLSGSCP